MSQKNNLRPKWSQLMVGWSIVVLALASSVSSESSEEVCSGPVELKLIATERMYPWVAKQEALFDRDFPDRALSRWPLSPNDSILESFANDYVDLYSGLHSSALGLTFIPAKEHYMIGFSCVIVCSADSAWLLPDDDDTNIVRVSEGLELGYYVNEMNRLYQERSSGSLDSATAVNLVEVTLSSAIWLQARKTRVLPISLSSRQLPSPDAKNLDSIILRSGLDRRQATPSAVLDGNKYTVTTYVLASDYARKMIVARIIFVVSESTLSIKRVDTLGTMESSTAGGHY